MDFIERWFHLAPDNGSGTTEALLLLAAFTFIALFASRRRLAELTRRRFFRREKTDE